MWQLLVRAGKRLTEVTLVLAAEEGKTACRYKTRGQAGESGGSQLSALGQTGRGPHASPALEGALAQPLHCRRDSSAAPLSPQ